MEGTLKKLYFDPDSPVAFAGAARLIKEARKYGISRTDVTGWLSGQDAYTLHKGTTKRYKRRRYTLLGIDDLWQADLADVSNLARHNDGYKFWLVIIDAFSKFLWVVPIKNKLGSTVADALNQVMLNKNRKPRNLNTDSGTEFTNRQVQQLLKTNDVNFYTAKNPDTKASFAERVIRSIKGRVYRYMTHKNSKRYIDDLDRLVAGYNNSLHRSIGMAPIEVTPDTEDTVRRRLQGPEGAR
jgi:hypothetical protein